MSCKPMTSAYFAYFFSFAFYSAGRFYHAKKNTDAKRTALTANGQSSLVRSC